MRIGNEGDIEAFAQNTGFMWDIAEEFHAMVVCKFIALLAYKVIII